MPGAGHGSPSHCLLTPAQKLEVAVGRKNNRGRPYGSSRKKKQGGSHGKPSEYVELSSKDSDVKCVRPECERKVNLLALRLGDLFCSRECHDLDFGITHPSASDLVGSLM